MSVFNFLIYFYPIKYLLNELSLMVYELLNKRTNGIKIPSEISLNFGMLEGRYTRNFCRQRTRSNKKV